MQQTYPLALVVDDSMICRAVNAALLRELGFCIAAATNGIEAVSIAQKAELQLILMDCDMPEMDGLSATLAIRQMECAMHVVIIGVTSRANREECLLFGMDDQIQKPLTRQGLRALLKVWGFDHFSSPDEIRDAQHRLHAYQSELDVQSSLLSAQHKQLQHEMGNLDYECLAEWERSLAQREWALKTRMRFLDRRVEGLRHLDDYASGS